MSVQQAPPSRIRSAVALAFEAVGWQQALSGAGRILLKPNLGYDLPAPGATTSPAVLEAVVEFFVGHGIEVTIIEADQVLVDVEKAARAAGVPGLCSKYGASWLNLSGGAFLRRSFAEHRVFHQVELPTVLDEARLVTIPVMNTHAKTVISGAVKNQWGVLPIDRHRYHSDVNQALAELYWLVSPALALMDATVCMEGNGPKTGTPRRVDHLLASTDAFALDCVAAQLMGFSIEEVPHLQRILQTGGPAAKLLGELPELEPFQRPKHNLVSMLETKLRASRLAPLVFNTPLFRVCYAGAWAWYRARGAVMSRIPAKGVV